MSGDITISKLELEEMMKKAADAAVQQALERIGLHDKEASEDLRDLRSFISSIRFARRTAIRAAIQKAVDLLVTGGVIILVMKYAPEFGTHADALQPPR